MRYLVLFLFISCSTLKKTIVYSSMSGGMAGATAGALLSPNRESQGANAAIFGLVGAGLVGLTAYALYEDDPRNKKLPSMIMPPDDPNEIELDLGNIKLDANLKREDSYSLPRKELPKELEGKVKEQYLIKYQSKEQYLNKGNKTYYIPSFQIYEHAYSELGENNE